MGKKNKKSKNTQDSQLTSTNEIKLQEENADLNTSDTVNKSKNKRKRDLNGTVTENTSEKCEESFTPADNEVKVKKKKKRSKSNDQEPNEEAQNDVVINLNEDQIDVPKKKKKKNELLGNDTKKDNQIEDNKPQKDSNKKKDENSFLNDPGDNEIAPKIENVVTQKKKKGKGKKAKTGAPVLNDEESQVTEEDIDKFIDELDEEDNKQYEDWVKLLDARLSKKSNTE